MALDLLEVKTVPLVSLYALAAAGTLYAILDACDAPSVPPRMAVLGESRAISLYRGLAEEDYSAFAPYLAQVDEELLEWIATLPDQKSWGIFAQFAEPLDALRTHFRHFLIVSDPQGEPMYFRFYDPRVLRKFLPTCTAEQLGAFYGMVAAFLTDDGAETGQLTEITRAPHLPPPARVTHSIGERFAIRPPQMEAFGAEAEAAFEQRVIEHLREHHDYLVSGFDDASLLPMVQTGLSRARRYGMTWESTLTGFVALMFEAGLNFDSHPHIRNLLTDPRIVPEKKVDALRERIPAQTWQEAAHYSDASEL